MWKQEILHSANSWWRRSVVAVNSSVEVSCQVQASMVDAIEEFRYGERNRRTTLKSADDIWRFCEPRADWAGALGSWRRFRVVKALIKMKRAYQFRCSE
jgi:hypothetical protein